MHPEDRVLVGVMRRKKDFQIAREQHWYRIPKDKAPRHVSETRYLAFFFSGTFGDQGSGIHYYARQTGHELLTRLQLLPDEPDHEQAQQEYYKFQFRELLAKVPPILNPSKRRFSFIYTTWDRFVSAHTLDDLYSRADHLVDRIFYALQDAGYRPTRLWELETAYPQQGAQVRVLCEAGEVVASTLPEAGIPIDDDLTTSLKRIRQEIAAHGGPKMLMVPLE